MMQCFLESYRLDAGFCCFVSKSVLLSSHAWFYFSIDCWSKNNFNLHEAGDFGVVLISFNFVLFCSNRVEITLDDNIK